jgi:hypothetical protein
MIERRSRHCQPLPTPMSRGAAAAITEPSTIAPGARIYLGDDYGLKEKPLLPWLPSGSGFPARFSKGGLQLQRLLALMPHV